LKNLEKTDWQWRFPDFNIRMNVGWEARNPKWGFL